MVKAGASTDDWSTMASTPHQETGLRSQPVVHISPFGKPAGRYAMDSVDAGAVEAGFVQVIAAGQLYLLLNQ
jgi:hypothetical protein